MASTFSVNSYNAVDNFSSQGLYAIRKSSEFDRWLIRFISCIETSEYHMIIDNPNLVSTEVKEEIVNIFKTYVHPEAYPMWFRDQLDQNLVTSLNAILSTITIQKQDEKETDLEILTKLTKFKYNKQYPVIFRNEVFGLLNKVQQIRVTEKMMSEQIINSPTDEYYWVAQDFRKGSIKNLNELLKEIKLRYEENDRLKKNKVTTHKEKPAKKSDIMLAIPRGRTT